ncbi:hypothetical protein GBA52_008217 [Prunus armeniaca]|nr:hypothetical protein GBA52_008217 [Prunus armeniaca]
MSTQNKSTLLKTSSSGIHEATVPSSMILAAGVAGNRTNTAGDKTKVLARFQVQNRDQAWSFNGGNRSGCYKNMRIKL